METEQARPLAPAADRPSSDDDEAALHLKKIQRRKFIKICGFLTAFVLIHVLVIITLIFTVFRVKDPVIKMNGITVTQSGNSTILKAGTNLSFTADVSVKNPNVASFKYSNTTTTLYYHGTVIGEAHGPPGQARPRRTMRMNITANIITDRIISNPSLQTELGLGLLNLGSFSRIPGRVKILNVIRRHVVVKMNCTFAYNISSQEIQTQKCKRKVKL